MTTQMRLRKRILFEAWALKRTFSYHPNNHDVTKFFIIVLVITWGVITAGIAFQYAEATPTYGMLTALIWALVGRVWGGEAKDMTGGAGGSGGL